MPELEPIFEYIILLAKHGLESPEATAFKAANQGNAEFVELAPGAEYLVWNKEKILRTLNKLLAKKPK